MERHTGGNDVARRRGEDRRMPESFPLCLKGKGKRVAADFLCMTESEERFQRHSLKLMHLQKILRPGIG